MYRAGKEVGRRTRAKQAAWLLLLASAISLAAVGCRKKPLPKAEAGAVRVTRYNCNIAEAHDVIDVYAEVVNGNAEGTGPLDLVARVIRPEEEIVEGRTSMGRLGAHEARQVSLRFACKGRVALRHISVTVEPTPEREEMGASPQGAGRQDTVAR